jgi:molecular chaperone DnaK (HSP70)
MDQIFLGHSFVSKPIINRKPTLLSLSSNPGDAKGIGVGIDLGTTNSAVAYLDGSTPRIMEIPNNGRTMKSVVAFDENDEPLVGNDAISWELLNKKSAYRHFKRVIGTGSTFMLPEIADVVPHVIRAEPDVQPASKKKKKNKNKKPSLVRRLEDAKENPTMLGGLTKPNQFLSPEVVSSQILKALVDVASERTKQTITRAVIGVPAYFNDAQRDATVRAAQQAGIDKVKLLREPEAAALAYGVDKGSQEEEFVLVFDLGGGTYDVSILLVEEGLTEIVCTSGDSQLGGSNFDWKIAKRLASLTKGCGKSKACFDIMVRAAEMIRIHLSNNRASLIALPLTDDGWLTLEDPAAVLLQSEDDELESGTNNSTHLFYRLTRIEMEKVCIDEFQQLLRPIREVAVMAGALLPGDASPSIVESAIEMEGVYSGENFYDENENTETPPEEAMDFREAKKVQQKGRKKARQVAKKERKFRDETRKVTETQPEVKVRAEGISGRPISRVVLVGGATRMPAIGRIISALIGVVPQKTVDPDEAVALGCAVHVGVLDGNEEMGTVLNPMQAALLRAVVEKQKRDGQLDGMVFEDEFGA